MTLPKKTIRGGHFGRAAIADLLGGFLAYRVWSRFAVLDIQQRFQRSLLGPLWITLSLGIMVAALGLVFSTVFKQDVQNTLPYIATGLIFWGLLTNSILDGSVIFIANGQYIRNIPLNISFYLYRMLAKNIIVLVFNMAIYVVIFVIFRIDLGISVLLFIPGFFLFVINMAWMALAAGILSTRYRDIPQVISSVIQVIFFLTPVFWSPQNLPARPAFIFLNPLYHLLELVRAPLLGKFADPISWTIAVAMAVLGSGFTLYLYRRAYARIAYWV